MAVLQLDSATDRIHRRLTRVAITLVLVGLLIGLGAGGALIVISLQTQDALVRSQRLEQSTNRWERALLDQQRGHRGYALTANDTFLDPYRDGVREAETASSDVLSSALGDPAAEQARTEVERHALGWRWEWAEPVLEELRQVGRADAADAVDWDDGKERFDRMRGAFLALRTVAETRVQEALSRVEVLGRSAALMLFVTVFATLTGILVLARYVRRTISDPLDALAATANALGRGADVRFERKRDDEIGVLATTLERLRLDAADRYADARRSAERDGALNQLAELISVARSEESLVSAAVAAVHRLLPETAGDVLLQNASHDRLVVAASWGEGQSAPGAVLRLDTGEACLGMARSGAYVSRDLEVSLAIRCAAHPRWRGTVVCLPMAASGEVVGVIHLERPAPDAFAPAELETAQRIAERITLALANRRLMRTMEGLAMTDGLTGLHNARFFDPLLERQLAAAERDGEPLAVVMVDLDHFKQLNDTYGHPAGDAALRAFAQVLRSNVRGSDTVARYGGEEFVIALRDADRASALEVSEKIRRAVEELSVEVGPGRFVRITASFGVAATDVDGFDRSRLLTLADKALYQAKQEGRNRVAGSAEASEAAAASGGRAALVAGRGGTAGRRSRPPVQLVAPAGGRADASDSVPAEEDQASA